MWSNLPPYHPLQWDWVLFFSFGSIHAGPHEWAEWGSIEARWLVISLTYLGIRSTHLNPFKPIQAPPKIVVNGSGLGLPIVSKSTNSSSHAPWQPWPVPLGPLPYPSTTDLTSSIDGEKKRVSRWQDGYGYGKRPPKILCCRAAAISALRLSAVVNCSDLRHAPRHCGSFRACTM